MLHVPFSKMHGTGNDFIVLDNRFFNFSEAELAGLARRFCPRRFGVGADGLLALDHPATPDVHYRMRYRNADGSLATMCGNGARCLARFAREAGIEEEPLIFDSDAGRYRASISEESEDVVRVFVPPPKNFREVRLGDGRLVCTIWTGTPHVVVFVDDLDSADLEAIAPPIRRDPAFLPEGTNVNLVERSGAGRIRLRTFEKGVEGETLACGTGALAAALVTRLTDRHASSRFEVSVRGGRLTVGFELNGEDQIHGLYLEGPAVTVFTGILELDPATLSDGG